MEKGQASIEVIMIAVLVIALSTIIVSKALSTQTEIFPTATARQAAIGKISELETNYSLDFISSVNCETEIKVWAHITPAPSAIDNTAISSAIRVAVQNLAGTKTVNDPSINPETPPTCT